MIDTQILVRYSHPADHNLEIIGKADNDFVKTLDIINKIFHENYRYLQN